MENTSTIYATDRIRDLIIAGQLKPNEHIEIGCLSSTYDLPKEDVAGALAILENEGFVTYSFNRPIVRKISNEEIDEWIQKRYSIELEIIEKLSTDINEADLIILERSLKEQKDAFEANDVVRFLELNADFHYLLASLAGFPTAAHWFKVESTRLKINELHALDNYTKFRDCYEEHASIVHSLRHRRPATARDAMSRHLSNTKTRITAKQ